MSHEVRAGALAVAGFVIACGGCAREAPERAYQRAEAHLYRAEYNAARADAERQLRYWRNQTGEEWNWKFRNLLAETLLSMGKPAEAPRSYKAMPGRPNLRLGARSISPWPFANSTAMTRPIDSWTGGRSLVSDPSYWRGQAPPMETRYSMKAI